ncbi:efflux RND transporter periplasmic adaptor subunit [Roseovarius aestuariivivens]|uniref:efflux RND transporter periplasmic adaptor subunit n=1 Tax=Roseovarius aestuariivivens TaxID=1888910 RepID=UPI001080D631|nr:efflux RND transporter periplasmic adaptor subunit [Roseovarius aestuariivivens]
MEESGHHCTAEIRGNQDRILRFLLRAIFFLILLATTVFGYKQLTRVPDVRVTYMTDTVIEGPLRDEISATGAVNAVVTVEVGSQLSGRIAKLLVDFNDIVSRDQPVAQLDAQTYEARLAEAKAALDMARATVAIKQAELDRAKAERDDAASYLTVLRARLDGAQARFDAAKADWDRKVSLDQQNLMTAEAFSAAELNFKLETAALQEAQAVLDAHSLKVQVAEANVARQEADLLNSRANIPQRKALLDLATVEFDRTVIRSPIDGVVIRRNVSEGQTVAASLEAPTLFTIAKDLTQMEIHARIDETDIGMIQSGLRAEITVDAYPDRRFEGLVKQIRKAPEVIQNVVTYTVIITTKNPDLLLLPGMTANVRIVVMETEPLVKVPRAALSFVPDAADTPDGGPNVWVLDDSGAPRPVSVTATGAQDRTHVAVSPGELKIGQAVIINEISQQAAREVFGIRLGF